MCCCTLVFYPFPEEHQTVPLASVPWFSALNPPPPKKVRIHKYVGRSHYAGQANRSNHVSFVGAGHHVLHVRFNSGAVRYGGNPEKPIYLYLSSQPPLGIFPAPDHHQPFRSALDLSIDLFEKCKSFKKMTIRTPRPPFPPHES